MQWRHWSVHIALRDINKKGIEIGERQTGVTTIIGRYLPGTSLNLIKGSNCFIEQETLSSSIVQFWLVPVTDSIGDLNNQNCFLHTQTKILMV